MRNLLLTLRFHGAAFHGSAIQPNAPTVQGVLQPALERLAGEPLALKCCSRTDAGVHARVFCVSVRTACRIPCERMIPALNAALPEAMAVTACREAPEDFHARYSCKGKRYVYRIHNSAVRDPFLADRAWRISRPLNEERLNREASAFLGRHDFSSFCAAGGGVEDHVREMFTSRVYREGELVLFEIAGDGFLYHMVRIMVGTLLAVHDGKCPSVREVLAARDRSRADSTAPAHGLCLEDVLY